MKILVACEFSGIVRDAFISKGHNAISCDLLPTERPGPHIIGNVLTQLSAVWDMILAFPPCTRLCNSGVRWLNERNLWGDMRTAAAFFRTILSSAAGKIAVENPVPHHYALDLIGRDYSQIIQPWQFGHRETKKTCLWLKGLPLLRPSKIVAGPYKAKVHGESPGPHRWKNRSRTYQGIADAMAAQWGDC